MAGSNKLHRLIADSGVVVSCSLSASQVKYFEVCSCLTFFSTGVFIANTRLTGSNSGVIPGVIHLVLNGRGTPDQNSS